MRNVVPFAVTGALVSFGLTASPAAAQVADSCPAVEEGVATPFELRIGDMVLRAGVSGERATEGEGTRVEGRLVGCERERLIGEPVDPEADAPAVAEAPSVLRLLHDLRVAFQVAPDADGCVRASVEVEGAAGSRPAVESDRPLSLQLCGLPGL